MLLRKLLCIFVFVYLKVLNTSCEKTGSTLAFAIDDTRSMWNDIDQVKIEAMKIMEIVLSEKTSEVKDFVLVTINDPDATIRTITKSPQIFLQELNRIYVHNYGNVDCPEMSLTGIEKALKNSRSGSYLYVFTDASAKDYELVNTIKSLAIKKQIQVVFVLTGDCGYPEDLRYRVYHDIAAASSGQVFEVKKSNVHWVLQFIKILLKGKNSVITKILVPPKNEYTSVKFSIDEKADYAVISVAGKKVHLQISTKDQLYGYEAHNVETVMWEKDAKIVKLLNPKPGNYYAWVKGTSTVSVTVYARTDFTFEHGFSILEPKSTKDTTKQPIAGQQQHLSINVTDPEHSVDIISVQILDMKEHTLMELPLRKTDGNFYITDAFISPTDMFKIAVNGKIKKTHKPIKRLSRTAIVPIIVKAAIPETEPKVSIKEGAQLDVEFGAKVTLTCDVAAHPPPKIEWYTTGGTSMPFKSSEIEKPTYISYLKLENIKYNKTYVCRASNKKGTTISKIQVGVRPVFSETSIPTVTVTPKYAEDVTIHCNIKSQLPITIKWYVFGKEVRNTNVHAISADGTELTLKSVDLGMQGKYTCEASLNSDPTLKKTQETEVKIPGLARPVIKSTDRKIQVAKREKIELNCKISGGYPKPRVQWFKQNGNTSELLPHETSEVLTVARALFTHAGQYKCVAENDIGSDTAEFEVTVSSLPEVVIGETIRTFSYDSNVQFTCRVESQAPLTIVWKDEKGSVLQSKVTQTSEYEYTNRLMLQHVKKSDSYVCVATNNVGPITEMVNVTVLSPFDVREHFEEITEINYGTEKTLRCNIKSAHPMKIKWYQQNIGVKSSKKVIDSSDKYSISRDGTELKIIFMDLNMVGKYSCEASLVTDPNEKVIFSTNVQVVGVLAPEVTEATTVLDGKKFKAICRVKGVPKPSISWQFKSKNSDEFTAISGSEEELNIPELKLSDTGVYKCTAINVLGQAQRDLNVVVEERPIITNQKKTYFGIEGDLVLQIPCNVTGFPDPTIVWKEGSKTIENDSKYVVKGNVLYIKSPVRKDTKKITCEAVNKLGTATMTFDAIITDTFENDENYYGKTHDIYVEEGKLVTIKCDIVNADSHSVRWYRNGQKTDQTGSAYVIDKATVSDDGNYTCRMNTNEGSKSENYVLDVGMPPTFQSESPSPKTIDWQKSEVLDCAANSKPEAQIEWLYNGEKVESLNNFSQHPVTDWGEFTCIVSNVHGTIQRNFKIITSGCYIKNNMGTQNMPVISDISEPAWPTSISNSGFTLKEHEKIKLLCSTHAKSPNAFEMLPTKVEITAQCQTEDKFIVDGKTYRYKDLQCKTKVEPSVMSTSEQCSGPNSEVILVGFGVNGFLNAYEVCYDKHDNVPLYASVSTILAPSENDVDPLAFTWSPAPGLGDGRPTGGFTCGASYKCCYSKGQLLNVNELAYGPAQSASFKENLNSISIWNPCNDSRTSWQKIEKHLKSESYNYQSWFSWTGASDYASKNGGLVPRYLWKVMNYEGDSSVMVYVNDDSPVASDIRCTRPCDFMTDSTDKFLYCCSLEEFSKAFHIPVDTFNFE